ncbi:MAG: OsmC family protein [Planctomycetota bacterium]|jgi:uncharacterized OsmC-like protein
MKTTQETKTIVNGIDVEALQGAIDQISENPAAGQTNWAVRSEWKGGTQTEHHVETAEIGGEEIARGFTLKIDEPHELCGTNTEANPQEYLLSAINACMMVGYSAVAALMGIELEKLEVTLEGDIDLRGFLAIDESVPNGYESLRQTVRISSNASPEALQRLHEAVLATSPNYFNVTQAIPTNSKLIIQ